MVLYWIFVGMRESLYLPLPEPCPSPVNDLHSWVSWHVYIYRQEILLHVGKKTRTMLLAHGIRVDAEVCNSPLKTVIFLHSWIHLDILSFPNEYGAFKSTPYIFFHCSSEGFFSRSSYKLLSKGLFFFLPRTVIDLKNECFVLFMFCLRVGTATSAGITLQSFVGFSPSIEKYVCWASTVMLYYWLKTMSFCELLFRVCL